LNEVKKYIKKSYQEECLRNLPNFSEWWGFVKGGDAVCIVMNNFGAQIHYLMCLSANYAHIRDHEKFQELQELQYLQDPTDMSTTSKDRF